ncbi:MAG: RagB/SusD family nutrient uptake outer membrane protein [Capnocytophaga sp.]|nr:RagB/SusD family nutrient uptake outer membrane protein [Capnocytophaga sp.]
MKRINKIFVAITTSFLLNGCFSLDQTPYDSLITENVSTKQDADFWVNGMYVLLRDNVQGKPMYLSDIQADYLNRTLIGSIQPSWNDVHTWNYFVASDGNTAAIWKNYYLIIQNINAALEGIDKIIESGTESDIDGLNTDRGELLLGRAYCYSYLVTHFCKAYNETSATTDLGLPILDKITVKNFPARSTLKQTYEFILSDIAQAKTLLEGKTGSAGATSFTIDAAKALQARVLLYKNEWQQAYGVAKSLIDAGAYPLATTQSGLESIWYNDDNQESITQLFTGLVNGNDTEVLSSVNDIYLDETSFFGMTSINPQVVPTQYFVDLFDNSDFRKNVFIEQKEVEYLGNYYSLYLVNKYPNNEEMVIPGSFSAISYAHKPKLFRIAEIYLIAAEAAYKKEDNTNAEYYLNKLRTARGIGSVTYSDLWQEIQNERNRELAFEGFRLIDIKRWSLPVTRNTPQNEDFITKDAGTNYYNTLNIPAGYYKMVWPIPPADILLENGVLEQNTGW